MLYIGVDPKHTGLGKALTYSIMKELKVDAATVQWLTTVYLLVNGIMEPVTAFLLDKYTTRFLFFFYLIT